MLKYSFVIFFMVLTVFTIVFAAGPPPILDKSINSEQATALAKYLRQTANFNVEDKASIVKLKKDINDRLASDNTNPDLWFFKGRLLSILHSIHVRKMQVNHFSREQIRSDPNFLKLRDESIAAYRHALELDSQAFSNEHLNYQMLGTISEYVFSDANMRASANRKILDRVKEHPEERTTDIENWEFKVYGNIVTAYVDEKRYDEALSVLEEMKEKFPYAQSLKEIDEAVGRIEARKAEALSAEKEAEKNQDTAPGPASAKESEKPQPQNAAPEPTQTPQQPKQVAEQKPEPPDTTKSPTVSSRLSIVIAALAVLIIAVFVLVRRKSK